jgi:hypothetical protein
MTDKSLSLFDAASLARNFRDFAATRCRDFGSELYKKISLAIADDVEMLELAGYAHRKPVPHLFMAAVHYLLLQGAPHPLWYYYYPDESGHIMAADKAFPNFKDFCLQHTDEIKEILKHRMVQTTHVTRCSALLPAFSLIGEQYAKGKPLALLEFGSSAGLNLFWDGYGYTYHSRNGSPIRVGVDSPIQVDCELRGNKRPHDLVIPKVSYRLGMDLHPIDVHDPNEVAWLQALIWPEHRKHSMLLQQASELASSRAVQVIEGNAVEILPRMLKGTPKDHFLCVFASFVVYQFSEEERHRLYNIIEAESKRREFAWISLEWHDKMSPSLEIIACVDGRRDLKTLLRCDGHGDWIEWLL